VRDGLAQCGAWRQRTGRQDKNKNASDFPEALSSVDPLFGDEFNYFFFLAGFFLAAFLVAVFMIDSP
jgi:hypothetical protein